MESDDEKKAREEKEKEEQEKKEQEEKEKEEKEKKEKEEKEKKEKEEKEKEEKEKEEKEKKEKEEKEKKEKEEKEKEEKETAKEKSRKMTPTRDDIAHCKAYFDRQPLEWSYEGFLSHCSLAGSFQFSLLNSRYVKSLEAIESCRIETPDRRKKARSLIDRHKAAAHQRRSKDAADIAQRTIVHGDVIGEVNAGGDFITAGGNVSVNNTGRSSLKRTAQSIASSPSSVKRRSLAPMGGKVVCDGDVIQAGGSVDIDNSDRCWEEIDISAPSSVADDTLPTAKDVPSSPIADESYLPSTSSPPPPQDVEPYSDLGDIPCHADFVASYLVMAHKHKFSTEKILEDHIFRKVRSASPNSDWLRGHPILHWIVDLQDPVITEWFTKAEKEELQSWGPPLPPRDTAFEYAVERFPKVPTSSEQLWDIIESPSRPPGEVYDRARHSSATYANSAAGSILSTIESYTTCAWLGPEALHEGWFGSNLWSPLIDRCLHGIPKLAVSRTEIKSRSSQNCKLRFDAIIRAQLANDVVQEFGAVEVARVAAATAAGKQEGDAEKLVSVLRDMLAALDTSVHGDADAMSKVQVVGIQNVGFKMDIWTMHMLGRKVAVLHRGHGRCVPTTPDEFWKVIDVMRAVVRARWIVQRSMDAVIQWNEDKRRREEDEL